MVKIRKLINELNFDILKMPSDVKKFANGMIVLTLATIFVPNIISFALKGSQYAFKAGYSTVSIILLMLYFGDRVINSLLETLYDIRNDTYNQLRTNKSTSIILNLVNITKSKVFKEKDGIILSVEQSEILKVSKDYLSNAWALYLMLPTTLVQTLFLLVMMIATVILEIKTSTIAEASILTGMLIVCTVIYFILSNKRIKVFKSYRKTRKENESESEVMLTEIKSTEYISKKDFSYHAEKLREKLEYNIKINKFEHLKLNKIFIMRSLVASVVMIIILVLRLIISGEEFNIGTIVDVVALGSIYSTILNQIGVITKKYENIMDTIVDIDSLYENFNNINNVYESEMKKNIISSQIQFVDISEFKASYNQAGAFSLINNSHFTLSSGDTVMAYGRTGCGKSTLINLLTGKMCLPTSPIRFSNGKEGYFNSISYQTDKSMSNNFVLNEITLTDDFETINRPKLIEIICGLQLKEEIIQMVQDSKLKFDGLTDEEKIFEFMKIRKIRDFSSGQMQRLALVKLLYCLDETIQLVALDEPFNRLDDDTCLKCIKFIESYVHRNSRILIIATHQVEICKNFCNIEISFGTGLAESTISVKKK